jgi:pyrrolidone-carboxylate peptidase
MLIFKKQASPTNAGVFLCNEVLYRGLQATAEKDIPTGFVHFGKGMKPEQIQQATILIVNNVREYLVEQKK